MTRTRTHLGAALAACLGLACGVGPARYEAPDSGGIRGLWLQTQGERPPSGAPERGLQSSGLVWRRGDLKTSNRYAFHPGESTIWLPRG